MSFLLVLGSCVLAHAQIYNQRASLKGLTAIHVVSEDVAAVSEIYGLTREEIQVETEVMLRLAGIKVVTLEETAKNPGAPFLNVQIELAEVPKEYYGSENIGLYVYSVRVNLFQKVLLHNGTIIHAITWSSGYGGVIGKKRLRDLQDDLKAEVNKFINDYLAANPK